MNPDLASSIQDDEPLYDAQDVAIYLNGKLVKFFNGDDLVDVSWANDRITWTVDAQGSNSAVRKHDDRGTITMHLNRASENWQEIMEMGASTKYVRIDIQTPFEHVYTSKALLTKNPDIKVGGDAQTVDAAFSAGQIVLEPKSN